MIEAYLMNSGAERVKKCRLRKIEAGYSTCEITLKNEVLEKLKRVCYTSGKSRGQIIEKLIIHNLHELNPSYSKYASGFECASLNKQLRQITKIVNNPEKKAFCDMTKRQQKMSMKRMQKERIKIHENKNKVFDVKDEIKKFEDSVLREALY